MSFADAFFIQIIFAAGDCLAVGAHSRNSCRSRFVRVPTRLPTRVLRRSYALLCALMHSYALSMRFLCSSYIEKDVARALSHADFSRILAVAWPQRKYYSAARRNCPPIAGPRNKPITRSRNSVSILSCSCLAPVLKTYNKQAEFDVCDRKKCFSAARRPAAADER